MKTIVVSVRVSPTTLASLVQTYESAGKQARSLANTIRWALGSIASQGVQQGLAKPLTSQEAEEFLAEAGLAGKQLNSKPEGPEVKIPLSGLVSARKEIGDLISQTDQAVKD
ncbi:MAG: hypothetical protein KKH61_19880, partial [Gammaproteobacteria bacterium]|nr:hypothetical protein [Gammaproteobacteria bacterium]